MEHFVALTKCVIKETPPGFEHLTGQSCVACSDVGMRGTGTQQFKLDSGGAIYGNADSGFVVETR